MRLITIPSTDREFGAFAEKVLASLDGTLSEEVLRRELERRLARFYPGAEVRIRDSLASYAGTTDVVWYAMNRAFTTPIREWVEIAAPREHVFAIYLDRYPEWQSAVDVRRLDTPVPGAITTYAATYEIFGRRFDGRFDVVEVDAPRFIRVEATGRSGIAVWYVTSFRDTAAGTLVEVVGDYDLPGRLLPEVQRFIVDRVIARDIRRAHRSLKELVARSLPAPSSQARRAG